MMIPGFPNGRPCAKCIVFWLAVIVAAWLAYQHVRGKAAAL